MGHRAFASVWRFAILATLSTTAVAAMLLAGGLTSRAVQNPSVSFDMVTPGNTYDDATNTMTLGSIENCLTTDPPGNNAQHTHQVHLVIQNVEDLVGWQARLNYLGNLMRPNTVSFLPFTDNNTGQNISFLNLPIDQASSVHRDLVTAANIPAGAPPGPRLRSSAPSTTALRTSPFRRTRPQRLRPRYHRQITAPSVVASSPQ